MLRSIYIRFNLRSIILSTLYYLFDIKKNFDITSIVRYFLSNKKNVIILRITFILQIFKI